MIPVRIGCRPWCLAAARQASPSVPVLRQSPPTSCQKRAHSFSPFRSSSSSSSSSPSHPRFEGAGCSSFFCSNNNSDTTAAPRWKPPRLPGMVENDHDIERYLRQSHERIFVNNRKWAADKAAEDPGFFTRLAAGQEPEYLWIGCSDSRIPAEQITGLEPGEAFIHRNIANLVVNTDLNVMSVINYAVRHLNVKHIVVCGHYGCGGVKAALTPKDLGLLNPWLRNIRDVYRLHEEELDSITDHAKRYDRLVELNVIEQCRNVVKTAALQQSYAKKQYPIVHGWVFGFHDGLIKDLEIDFKDMLQKVQKIYHLAD